MMNKLIKISLALLIAMSIVGCHSKSCTQEDLNAKMGLIIQKTNMLKDKINIKQKLIILLKSLEMSEIEEKAKSLPEKENIEELCDLADEVLLLFDEMIADL